MQRPSRCEAPRTAQGNAMKDLPVSTVYLLKRTELAVRGCVEMALAELDLTPSQHFILVLVRFGQATSSAELARAMGVLPQSMTELIAPLERKGCIVRKPDPDNRRILRIELTAAGERVFDAATKVARRLERELLDDFSQRELALLNRSFTKLTEKAEAHSCHPKVRRLTRTSAKKTKPTATKPEATRTKRRADASQSRGKRQ